MITDKERTELGDKIKWSRTTHHYSWDDVLRLSKYPLNRNDLYCYEHGKAWSKNPDKLRAVCELLELNFKEFEPLLEKVGPEIHFEQFTTEDLGPQSYPQLLLAILNQDPSQFAVEINRIRVSLELGAIDIELTSDGVVKKDEMYLYERGQRFPPLYKLLAILRALNIKL